MNPLLLAIAGVFGGVAVEITRAILGRRKMDADAGKAITEAAVSLVEPLRRQAEALTAELLAEKKRSGRLEQALAAEQRRGDDQTERISRLEERVDALRVENAELRRSIEY